MSNEIGPVNFTEPSSIQKGSQPAQKEETSIFSQHDQNQDGKITNEEMGIKKTIDKILDMLPNIAKNEKTANVIKYIKAIAEKLGNNIEYDAKDAKSLEQVNADVTARQADAEALQKIAKNLKNNKTEEAVSDFEQLTLYSNIAIENADENHNVNAKKLEKAELVVTQMNEALKQAVDMAMDNAGKVDKTKLLIETIQGLTIKEVDVSRKDRLATGTANDKRVENGIERNADGIIVTLKYEYNGKEYSLKQTVDKLPKGYNPEAKLEERTVEITQDENAEAYFD